MVSTIKGMTGEVQKKFWRDADRWGMSRRTVLLITLMPVILIIGVGVMAGFARSSASPLRPTFRWLTAEDALLEWLQFAVVFTTSPMAAVVAVRLLRSGQRTTAVLYFMLALAAFVVAGEEISWGQRIFGWGTPEALNTVNKQQETNIHNIGIVQRVFALVLFLGSMYASFVPVTKAMFSPEEEVQPLHPLLIPPLFLVPTFLIMFSYKLFRMSIWEDPNYVIVKFGEGPELCLYFGLFMFVFSNLYRLRRSLPEGLSLHSDLAAETIQIGGTTAR